MSAREAEYDASLYGRPGTPPWGSGLLFCVATSWLDAWQRVWMRTGRRLDAWQRVWMRTGPIQGAGRSATAHIDAWWQALPARMHAERGTPDSIRLLMPHWHARRMAAAGKGESGRRSSRRGRSARGGRPGKAVPVGGRFMWTVTATTTIGKPRDAGPKGGEAPRAHAACRLVP